MFINHIRFRKNDVMVFCFLFWKFIEIANALAAMKTDDQNKPDKSDPPTRIRHHMDKKKREIEDLLMRNLMRTNTKLLQTFDLNSIVLF